MATRILGHVHSFCCKMAELALGNNCFCSLCSGMIAKKIFSVPDNAEVRVYYAQILTLTHRCQECESQWRTVFLSRSDWIDLSLAAGAQFLLGLSQFGLLLADNVSSGTKQARFLGIFLGPGSRHVSNGLTNIRRATNVVGRKLRGHVGLVGWFCL